MQAENGKVNQDGDPRLRLVAVGPGRLQAVLTGDWEIKRSLPSLAPMEKAFQSDPAVEVLQFDSQDLGKWDSGLLTFLVKVRSHCLAQGISVETAGLPAGIERLLRLTVSRDENTEAHAAEADGNNPLALIGLGMIALFRGTVEILAFLGETTLALGRLMRGQARLRWRDLFLGIQDCGPRALPIVTLISILVGLILAFVGAVQLRMFGAQIYVADLVGLGMAREMGAMMAAIIMAGRTGAAYAAHIGTMEVNEEIDALKTLGVSPMEFIVLPRMLALAMMMPLLCLYANLMGIIGGGLACVGMFDFTIMEYYHQTKNAVGLADFSLGVVKSAVFGVLVAIAGCMRGMQSGRSASAVGDAATSAVVTGIVAIIVADSIMTVVASILGV
jgi:phospholipid/cholesterol/gamma-HCH transport system permease protein